MKNVKVIEKEIKGAEWAKALDDSFKKNAKEIKVDGFRKGFVPKDIFIKKFGIESLYNDAVDIAMQDAYKSIMLETKEIPVVEPKIDIKAIDKDHVIFTFTLITHPEVKLGAYKNLGIKKEEVKVTKKDLDEEIARLASRFAEIVVKDNGQIIEGNTAVIDFDGYVDGKPLEGGKGENYPLEIGSHTFIPGFEEGLVGMKKGEEKELNLKFPENYTEELKNKDVTFKVKIEEIKERVLPAMDKNFYEDLGYKDVTTEEEFNAKVKESLIERKNHEADDKYLDAVMDKAIENLKVEINPEIVEEEVHRMMNQFAEQLKTQGLSLDQYMQFSGLSHEDFHKQLEPEATKRIKSRYLLEAIAKEEKIEVTEKEADEDATKLAEQYGITKEELLTEFGGLDIVKYDLQMRKALELLKEN